MKHFKAGVLLGLVMMYSPILVAQSPAPIVKSHSTQERLERLERRVKSLTEIMLHIDRLQQEMRELRGQVEVQAHALETLRKRQRDLYVDIDKRLNQQLGSGPSGGGGTERPPAAPAGQHPGSVVPGARTEAGAPPQKRPVIQVPAADSAGEAKAYQKAFNQLKQGRYDESISAFRRFLEKYPAGNYADNAQYWLGEANYVSRDFDTALVEFDKVMKLHPYSPKVPGAMLKTGFIYYEQQKWTQARKILSDLRRQYPTATESRLAKKRLDQMRAQGH